MLTTIYKCQCGKQVCSTNSDEKHTPTNRHFLFQNNPSILQQACSFSYLVQRHRQTPLCRRTGAAHIPSDHPFFYLSIQGLQIENTYLLSITRNKLVSCTSAAVPSTSSPSVSTYTMILRKHTHVIHPHIFANTAEFIVYITPRRMQAYWRVHTSDCGLFLIGVLQCGVFHFS